MLVRPPPQPLPPPPPPLTAATATATATASASLLKVSCSTLVSCSVVWYVAGLSVRYDAEEFRRAQFSSAVEITLL